MLFYSNELESILLIDIIAVNIIAFDFMLRIIEAYFIVSLILIGFIKYCLLLFPVKDNRLRQIKNSIFN